VEFYNPEKLDAFANHSLSENNSPQRKKEEHQIADIQGFNFGDKHNLR